MVGGAEYQGPQDAQRARTSGALLDRPVVVPGMREGEDAAVHPGALMVLDEAERRGMTAHASGPCQVGLYEDGELVGVTATLPAVGTG